jgi:hypothetical protein
MDPTGMTAGELLSDEGVANEVFNNNRVIDDDDVAHSEDADDDDAHLESIFATWDLEDAAAVPVPSSSDDGSDDDEWKASILASVKGKVLQRPERDPSVVTPLLPHFIEECRQVGIDPSSVMMMGKRARGSHDLDDSGEADTTPLRSDHPLVKQVLELESYDVCDMLDQLTIDDLRALHVSIAKEKNATRGMAALSLFTPGMPDLIDYERRIVERTKVCKSHGTSLTEDALKKSRFWDPVDGFAMAKLKRHIEGLLAVKSHKPAAKARTLSPPPVEHVPATRRGIFGWL